ncbi:hypothetical protein HMPREF3190_01276 [Umbribacter vaginalis]|nr:hypothetical protein HMPREF3190_01276 [Coriobacteriales bacterium DNF00809]
MGWKQRLRQRCAWRRSGGKTSVDVDVQARANVGIPDREGTHVNTSCTHQGTPVGTSPAHKDAHADK